MMTRPKSHEGRPHKALAVALCTLALAACNDPVAPVNRQVPPNDGKRDATTSLVITAMQGAGTMGDGSPRGDGVWLQAFELDVGVLLTEGYFDYIDYSVLKEDGNPAHLRVAPDAAGTAITDFVQTSSACVEFDGIGKVLNTGELLHFRARACDNGSPGVGLDQFAIWVPERLITHGGAYQRGPDMLSDGELSAVVEAAPVLIARLIPEIRARAERGLAILRRI